MKAPKVLDNKKYRVVDELKAELNKGSKLSIISAYFTIYAYAELKKELGKIDKIRFIFTEPTFVHKDQELIREYYIERNPEKKMSGNEFEIKLRNEMKQAAIDKIEKYNGCIIADSVGLGKTFTALAVIKYYELRNDRVLVIVPKKLRENWTIYTMNDKRNIFSGDRFNYDVLNHTDLSRTSGYSGEIISLRSRFKKESQFNRRIDLNIKIKNLEQRKAKLLGGDINGGA